MHYRLSARDSAARGVLADNGVHRKRKLQSFLKFLCPYPPRGIGAEQTFVQKRLQHLIAQQGEAVPMQLNVFIGEQLVELDIPEQWLATAEGYFEKMDVDFERGCQMGRVWLQHPTVEQRCRIVTDRLVTAIENRNEPMIGMMAGYLLKRMAGLGGVRAAVDGDLEETEFVMQPRSVD